MGYDDCRVVEICPATNRYRVVDTRRGVITGYRSTLLDAESHAAATGGTRIDDRWTTHKWYVRGQ